MSIELPTPLVMMQSLEYFTRVVSKAQYELNRSRFERGCIPTVMMRVLIRISNIEANDRFLKKLSLLIEDVGAEKVKEAVDFVLRDSPRMVPARVSSQSSLRRPIQRVSSQNSLGDLALPEMEEAVERKISNLSISPFSPRRNRLSSSSTDWEGMISPRSRKRDSHFERCPKCIATLDQGERLAREVLFIKYLSPEAMKSLSDKLKGIDVRRHLETLLDIYFHQQYYNHDWDRCVALFFENKSAEEIEQFSEAMKRVFERPLTEGGIDFNPNQPVVRGYPFDSPTSFQQLLSMGAFVEKEMVHAFAELKRRDLHTLRYLRMAELFSKALHWDSIRAFNLVCQRDKIKFKDCQSLAIKLGVSKAPRSIEWSILFDIKELFARPIFQHDFCIGYLMARIKILLNSTEDPEKRRVGEFILLVEDVAKQDGASLIKSIRKVFSVEGFRGLFSGNKNDGQNFTTIRTTIASFLPAFYTRHEALESSSLFKKLLIKANECSSCDPHVEAVVKELNEMNELLNEENFSTLWEGLCLIYFNEERLEVLFGEKQANRALELKRCLDLILRS